MRPHNTEEFEVIVLGAGIAGLLLASELALHHKVLVIEKQPEIRSHKYWMTDEECTAGNAEILPFVAAKYNHIDFIAYNGESYRCAGNYLLWDTERLISYLEALVTSRGSVILPGHTFYSYKLQKHKITIFANDLAASAKLAIDCMGYGSPIIYAKGIIDILGYYLLYGGTFTAAEKIDPVGLHNMSLSSKPCYVEAFPAGNKLHLILILPTSSAKAVSSLREEFDFVVNRSPYRRAIQPISGKREFLGGIIPVGTLRRRALDRLFFFGEAGQSNPAATATALTRMLYSYQAVASELSSRIKTDCLSAKDLGEQELSAIRQFDQNFQLALFREILKWDSDKFLALVQEMARTDNHDIVNNIMFGQTLGSAFNAKTIAQLLSRKSSNILRNLLQGLAKSVFS